MILKLLHICLIFLLPASCFAIPFLPPFIGYLIGKRRGGAIFVAGQRKVLRDHCLLFGGMLLVLLMAALLWRNFYPAAVGYDAVLVVGLMVWLIMTCVVGLIRCSGFIEAGKEARDGSFNLCRKCSYSLIGNTSGVCPEMGRRFRLRIVSGFGRRVRSWAIALHRPVYRSMST